MHHFYVQEIRFKDGHVDGLAHVKGSIISLDDGLSLHAFVSILSMREREIERREGERGDR